DRAALAALPELDLRNPAPLTPALAAWSRYYGIDFEARMPGVRHGCGQLPGVRGPIVAHLYRPATDRPRGSLLICHGYLDHSGLYGHVIAHALARQQVVVTWDLPGHGLSG